MKERPIIFSAPMVRALLAGTKTQTRRQLRDGTWWTPKHGVVRMVPAGLALTGIAKVPCPYGQPGDRLWVREAWQAFFDDEVPSDRPRGPRHTLGQPSQPDRKSFVFYRADGPGPVHPDGFQARWISPLHLPRKYSRITLEIVSVRVERLQDISESDAQAEGCALECMTPTGDDSGSAIYGPGGYRTLWESINGPGSWDANPWVWVIEFRRVTP